MLDNGASSVAAQTLSGVGISSGSKVRLHELTNLGPWFVRPRWIIAGLPCVLADLAGWKLAVAGLLLMPKAINGDP